MNRTPRALNRFLLGLLGLILIGLGGGLLWLSLDSGAARRWQGFAPGLLERVEAFGADTALPGQSQSWIWPLLVVAMVVAIVFLVLWAAAQGRGRTGTLISEYDDDGAPGRVAISGAVAEQALRSALQENPDVAAAAVSTYDVRGSSALRIRINPRQGAAPHLIAADATHLVEALDAALGREPAVLISIDAGRKLRFNREDRVR
ncbi:hypothetical protein MUG94_00780 [Arthrobacter gengyunqii]|uniref:Alkaline shock response membrane anchor protein AmaP n=1 Tax=Arthrobacter gengyunqii TaxID=2886940 RepID=A0A9X1S7A7_9MICC|nr:hypothetical protein [Arthrobacter gengyunqii]MCC3266281.1 hypothetical protein [Arthrobacter gengyunqii]MCC3268994.1 hypothetical protein [Arthrobacter gengyunqii]UOY96369.1 hypothetical protein MUG94_00780 [Arthrobacter gengyunqii]